MPTNPTRLSDITTLEQAEDMMTDLILEPWDDAAADAITQGLLDAAGASTYSPVERERDAAAALAEVMSAVEDASNVRSEFEHADDEDLELDELEEAHHKAFDIAQKRLRAFWRRYVV